jgi:hypothetical protein
LARFSGYMAADEVHDGPFCVLAIVDTSHSSSTCSRRYP